MRKEHTMNMAIKQAQRQHLKASQKLQAHLQSRSAAQQQLDALVSYAQETSANFLRHAGRPLHAGLLHQHQQFMARLDDAISRQHDAVEQLQQQLQALQTSLTTCEQRVSLLKGWQDRYVEQQQVELAKEEQKLNDNVALRRVVPAVFSRPEGL